MPDGYATDTGHHRGMGARRLTLDPLEEELTIGRRGVVRCTGGVDHGIPHRISPEKPTHRVDAHTDVVFADPLTLVHRVESRDRGHLGRGYTQHFSARIDAIGGDRIFLTLGKVQHR